MTTATNRPFVTPTKVALFITSSKPFPGQWVQSKCETAERSAISGDGLDLELHLEVIKGNFEGWTPFKLARDYVYPRLFEEQTTFAFVSFVVLDDESHEDKQLMIVGVHPDSFNGAALEIEATIRMEAEYAIDLPLTFHYGHQAITSYPCDPYDSEAERNAA